MPISVPRSPHPDRRGLEVDFYGDERRQAERIARRLFGRPLTPREYAGLAGAPSTAQVEVGTYRRGLYLEMHDPQQHAYQGVYLARHAATGTIVVTDSFHIHAEHRQRRGLGLSIFHRHVAQAQALGAVELATTAGRRQTENGYYTWPRFGFDGRLPAAIRRTLPPHLRAAQCVLDLIESDAGRRWWRQHGTTIEVRFDLAEESRSWQVFRNYLRERLARGDYPGLGKRSIPFSLRETWDRPQSVAAVV